MKGYLLDTNIALIAVDIPERLSSAIRETIENGPCFLSVVAYWEIMVKSMKGMLDIGNPRDWWLETLESLSLAPLLFRPEHVAAIYNLPPIHRDPFDRALIAQAAAENLTLLTNDRTVQQYASEQIQILG